MFGRGALSAVVRAVLLEGIQVRVPKFFDLFSCLADGDEVIGTVVGLLADGTLVVHVFLLDQGVPGTFVAKTASARRHHDSIFDQVVANWTFQVLGDFERVLHGCPGKRRVLVLPNGLVNFDVGVSLRFHFVHHVETCLWAKSEKKCVLTKILATCFLTSTVKHHCCD